MEELTIEVTKGKKTRSFKAMLLAHVEADALWSGGLTDTETIRPVWMILAGTDNELRPFVANLQTGRKAERLKGTHWKKVDSRFETLKSAGYQFSWQRTSHGSAVTVFLPDLFRLDPGMVDPKGASFVLLPAKSWLQQPRDPLVLEHLTRTGGCTESLEIPWVLGLAPIFVAYLDRRTRCPIIADPRFFAQILHAALSQGLASLALPKNFCSWDKAPWGYHGRLRYAERGLEKVEGYAKGLAFGASHANLEAFLSEQVQIYYEVIHGTA